MNITLTIPDEQAARVMNALCVRYGYQETIADPNGGDVLQYIPNPQTKAQFAREQIISFLKRITTDVELEEARKAVSVTSPDIT
jgi:hypothetical protein